MIQDFTQITGIGLAAFTLFLTYKLVSNHIGHNTEVLTRLADVIEKLEEWLKDFHKDK